MTSQLAIVAKNLGKTFRNRKLRKVEALAGLSLEVRRGEVFGFLGPNGAGKSTTIKLLLGLVQPTEGEAFLDGIPVAMPQARRRVGFLPENPAFYDFLSAREYLAFVGRAFGLSGMELEGRSRDVLNRLDLSHAAQRPIRSYSKGMVQRLGLAQTLLHDPSIYILDEPMSGLDPIGRALVKEIINELRDRGRTVFFSTHITADVELVCDRVGILVGGKLQAVNPVQDILASGVTGYCIKVRGTVPVDLRKSFELGNGEDELFLPTDAFARGIADLTAAGVHIELVEPRRRDLESFFLDVVQRSGQ